MTRSTNFGRLLQVTCLGLIGMLAVVGCGGSETNYRDGGTGGTTGDGGPTSVAALNVTPSSVNLGTLDVGAKGVATVTVTNIGKAASSAVAVTATAGLTVAGCTGQQLAASASCTITITAAPTVIGTFTGTVSISATSGAPTPLLVSVIANVAPPGLFSVTPAAIALGNIPVGTPAPKQTITVTAALAINDLAVSLNGVDVSKDATGTCTTILAAGASCTVVVNFTAASAGARSDSVTISGGGASGKTVTVPITATAQNPAKLVITPSVPQTLVATVGQTSPALNFAVANSGDVATGSVVVSVTGVNAADFTATSTCLLLAPLSGCTVSVVFKPAAGSTTAETAALVVTDSGVGASTVSVVLTGTPVPPSNLAITPATTDLGTVLVGTTGAATVFTVTNLGDTPSGALTVSISSAEFLITNDTCSAASLVAKTGACTISIALKPGTVGPKSATLTVTPVSGNAVFKSLTGTAVSVAGLSASPVSLDFGSVRVNNTSSAQTVTVTNTGGTATGVLTFTRTGDFGMFPIGTNTCSAALAPAAKCTFSVSFAPTGAVTTAGKVASYTVTDGTNSVTISVSGTALEAAPLSIVDPLDHLVVTSVKSCVRPTVEVLGADNICVTDTVLGATSVVTATVAVHMGTLPAGATDSGAITVAMGGTNKADFSILKNNCTAALLANSECTVTIAFVPTAAGVRQAVLNVSSTNGGSANASFQAIGLAVMQIVAGGDSETPPQKADGTLAALELDFGQVPLNGSITDRTHWYGVLVRGPLPAVKPTTTAPAPTNTLTIQLNNTAVPADFNYTLGQLQNPCTGVTIAFDQFSDTPTIDHTVTGTNSTLWFDAPAEYGVWCQFEVEFYPQTSKGDKTATIAASGSGGGSDTVTLTGTATGPLIITPSQAGFPGQLAVNDSTNNDFTSPITFTTISMVQNPNLTLTITNTSSTTPIGPITVALSGTNADQFIIVNDQCSDKSAALVINGGSCTVVIAFAPTSGGAKTATFTASGSGESATYVINANAGNLLPLTLTPSWDGSGVTVPAGVDFGTISMNSSSPWKAFTVTNPNPAGSPLSAQVAFGLEYGDYFEVSGSQATGGCGAQSGTTQLGGGQSCLIWVRFKPTDLRAFKQLADGRGFDDILFVDAGVQDELSSFVVGNTASQISIAQGATTSQMGMPGVTMKTLTYDFGNVAKTASSPLVTFTIANLGDTTVTLILGNPDLAPFTIDGTNTQCFGSRSVLQPKGDTAGLDKCTLIMKMIGNQNAEITPELESLPPDGLVIQTEGSSFAQAWLTGTTIKPAQLEAVGLTGPTTIDLGAVKVSTITAPVTIVIKNTGDVPATALHFTWAGGTADVATLDPFQVLAETTGVSCRGLSSLAAGATCKLTIQAAPSATVEKKVWTNNFTLSADGGLAVTNLTVKATVQAAASLFFDYYYPSGSALQYGFFTFQRVGTGMTANGSSSTAVVFQLENTSGGPATVNSTTLLIGDTTNWTLDLAGGPAGSPKCSALTAGSLANSSLCTFSVVFNPESNTPQYMFTSVQLGGVAGPTLGLEGQVQSPANLVLKPTSVNEDGITDLGEVTLGSTGTATFTLTNDGQTDSAAVAVSFTGAAPDDYSATGCTGVLAAGASCTITATVSPTAVGTRAATLNAAATTTVTAPLTAAGVIGGSTISLVPTSYTFAAVQEVGSTSTITAVITVKNNTNGHSTGALTIGIAGNTDSFTLNKNGCEWAMDATATPPGLGVGGATPVIGTDACLLYVTFTPKSLPAAPSTLSTTLTASATPGGTKSITITGTAKGALTIVPTANPTATALALVPATVVGSVTVALAANVDGPTDLLQTSLTGGDAASFFIRDNQCIASQLSNGLRDGLNYQCSITIEYVGGSTLTAKTTTLRVTDGTSGNTASLTVSFTP